MEEIKKIDAEYDTELERAIKFLYAIASKNQMTEETGHIASMYLQNLEQERSTRYIRNLEEENRILRTALKEKESEIDLAVSKERSRIVEKAWLYVVKATEEECWSKDELIKFINTK